MYEQLSIKVRIHLKDINVGFYIKLHSGTTFRNVLEIIYDGQFYENFNKSEYCALFYENSYIQDREAQIIRNFQLQAIEQKSSLIAQNSDIYTLEFIRNQEFTLRSRTLQFIKKQIEQNAVEANNTQDQFYQYTQSEFRKNQGPKQEDQFKQNFTPDSDFNKIYEIENNNQPLSDQADYQVHNNQNQSQLFKTQNDNLDRVSNPSAIKPQQQQIINSNINQDKSNLFEVQYIIQSKDILNEIQKTQLRLARFISLNSLRVDIDDFESIKTVHLDDYENFSLNQIKDFILRQTIQQGKNFLIKFNENENENMDQSTILRINKNYIRLYLHDRQLKKYSIQYNFNQNNEYFQLLFSEILPEGLQNEQINNQYNLQNQQGRIIEDKIIFGNEKKLNLVKQHSFIFQYQSLVIFKYELKYLSKSSQLPTEIFEAFFKSKFYYTIDKNNYVIDI